MISHPRISELLVKTGAFKDLDTPVILTSGELGIYYVNTENLLGDNGAWKQYGENSKKMIEHAIAMEKQNPDFGKVINFIARQVKSMTPKDDKPFMISGGQRRDWLFSGPVAATLRQPHLSLYKEGRVEAFWPDSGDAKEYLKVGTDKLLNTNILHISDLLTKASSGYRIEQGREKGWIPMIRQRQGTIKNLATVVTRLQGGEQILAEQNVNVTSFVAINSDFVKQHSTKPERALDYMANPTTWSKNYLAEHGALAFINTFDPKGEKLKRAKAFLDLYGNHLAQTGKLTELNTEVGEKYNTTLSQISKGAD